ncbi:MAG: hypothetical protein CMJ20_10245 [Phycisphaeraceae bacterium]|nr:hypothetical protein [Phycisphaeraceae bacterium]
MQVRALPRIFSCINDLRISAHAHQIVCFAVCQLFDRWRHYHRALLNAYQAVPKNTYLLLGDAAIRIGGVDL